jgi:glucan phosphoethanolaminetransferase (alkaline phosphatase superfamily)
MLLLLILYLVLPKQRPLLKDFIATCNGLLLFLIGTNLLYWAYDIFIAWYGQNAYEQWAFSNSNFNSSYLFISVALECLLAILLLFSKWRRTIWLSIILCLCSMGVVAGFITQQLYQCFFRDHLPSSWPIAPISHFQQWLDRLLPPLLFAATALMLYWLRQCYRNFQQAKRLNNPTQSEKP